MSMKYIGGNIGMEMLCRRNRSKASIHLTKRPPRREPACALERRDVQQCYQDKSENVSACSELVKKFTACSESVLKV